MCIVMTGAQLAGEVGCTGEQLVGGEVVADQRDPPFDQATGREVRR